MDRNPQVRDSAISCRILEDCISGESCYFEIEFQLTATGYQTSMEDLPPSEELMNRTRLNHYNLQNFVSSLNKQAVLEFPLLRSVGEFLINRKIEDAP